MRFSDQIPYLSLLCPILSSVLIAHGSSAQISLRTTAPALPRPNPAHIKGASTTNGLTITQNIKKLLTSLANQPSPALKRASFILLVLAPSESREPDIPYPRSADITDFHHIGLYFQAGGITPTTPPSQQDFAILNLFPEHWDEWAPPDFYEVPLGWFNREMAIDWDLTQALMPVERADMLLKAAGHTGEYSQVALWKGGDGKLILHYCFWLVEDSLPTSVEVMTGAVRRDSLDCFIDAPLSRAKALGLS